MKKFVLLVGATALLVLSLAAVAQAAKPTTNPRPPGYENTVYYSPQDIYDDYAGVDGSRARYFDNTYILAELQAYLDAMNDPAFLQYLDRGVYTPLANQVRRIMREMVRGLSFAEAQALVLAGASTEPAAGDDDHDTFPFTGFEVMLVLVGGLVLVGSGFVIRRAAR